MQIACIVKISVFFITAVIVLPLGVAAQNIDCEDQMIASFGENKFNSLVAQNAVEADFQCFQNSAGYYITDLPQGKTSNSFPDVLALESLNEEVFPVLTEELIQAGIFLAGYGIEVKPKHYGYFTIGNSDQLFVVYPQTLIRTLFEKQ